MKTKIILPVLSCVKCNHEWIPRNDVLPVLCPKCKSPNWNRREKKIIKKVQEDKE